MDLTLVQSMGALIEVELLASRLKKNKGKIKEQSFTSAATVTPTGDDLSYLPPREHYTRATLRDMPLVTDTGALLEPRGSLKYQTMERPMLLDEDEDTGSTEGGNI